jgi:DNA-directed RNA polymerase subunit M/transcription elongation factor TFIIS
VKTECQHDFVVWDQSKIEHDVFVMEKCKKCGYERMLLKEEKKRKADNGKSV